MIELSVIGMATAFVAGIISFLSPCVLPLVPGYVSFIGGNSLDQQQEPGGRSLKQSLVTMGLSLNFILGFTTVFVAFGASASIIGQWLSYYRWEVNIIGGVMVIIFGLLLSGVLNISWMGREFRYFGKLPRGGPFSAYLLGVAFAFGWTPCIGPVLGAILTLGATSALVTDGTALLAFYSLGLGIPFMLAALFTDRFMQHSSVLRKHGKTLQLIAGGLMILMGVAMITGYLNDFSIWILKAVPWLGTLG